MSNPNINARGKAEQPKGKVLRRITELALTFTLVTGGATLAACDDNSNNQGVNELPGNTPMEQTVEQPPVDEPTVVETPANNIEVSEENFYQEARAAAEAQGWRFAHTGTIDVDGVIKKDVAFVGNSTGAHLLAFFDTSNGSIRWVVRVSDKIVGEGNSLSTIPNVNQYM